MTLLQVGLNLVHMYYRLAAEVIHTMQRIYARVHNAPACLLKNDLVCTIATVRHTLMALFFRRQKSAP